MNLTLKLRLGFGNSSRAAISRPAMSMSAASSTFCPATLTATLNATSSPGSADGPTRCDSPVGPTSGTYGRVPAPVSLSARQAKAGGLLTSGTYGPRSSISSKSASLQLSLANRLQARTASRGSTLFKLTWKERVTPAGRRICALRASALRTSGSGSTGWPTSTASDAKWRYSTFEAADRRIASGKQVSLECAAFLAARPTPRASDGSNGGPNQANGALSTTASWATPTTRDHRDGTSDGTSDGTWPVNGVLGRQVWLSTGSPAETKSLGPLNPAHSRWLMGYPAAWDFCGATAMQSFRKSPRRSSKPI